MRHLAMVLTLALAGCGAGPPSPPAALPAVSPGAPGAAALEGNSVALVSDGAAAVDRIVATISAARSHIDAEIYEFDRAEIADALLAALARGVRVRVIADPTVDVNGPALARLQAGGAEVHLFPDGPMQIDHVKLLLSDEQVAVFGGMNWGRGSYRNHDFDLVVRGPVVAHVAAVFAADLARVGATATGPVSAAADPAELRIVTSYPVDEVRPAVLAAIAGARGWVFIEMYVLTDVEVITALEGAARRGVPVWIVFDPNQELNQAAALRLRWAGVATRFYPTHGEKLHAKAMVVDGRTLVVGSANWTSSGFTRNHELDAVIVSEPLAAQALARMEADWDSAGS
jgi:phosphatidylserine/phosphatidylglycerophosphate/cardiolipin synthase-like enzyme